MKNCKEVGEAGRVRGLEGERKSKGPSGLGRPRRTWQVTETQDFTLSELGATRGFGPGRDRS